LVNDTSRLFGLDAAAVTRADDGVGGRPLVHLATLDEHARRRPACATPSKCPHGSVTTYPRDLPVAGRGTDLLWRKGRRRCADAGCSRRTFTEQVSQIPARARLTERLRRAAGAAVCDDGRTVVQCARDHAASWPVVNDTMLAHAARVLPERTAQVTHPGIDETRRGLPVGDLRCGILRGLRGRRLGRGRRRGQREHRGERRGEERGPAPARGGYGA
jgi:transposase